MGPYLALHACQSGGWRSIQRLWYRLVCRSCGLGVTIKGEAAHPGRCVFVANHVSYLDIPVLGRVLDATFVAKGEIAGWPLIGWLAKVSGTVFIDRRRMSARRGTAVVSACLKRRQRLVLFPEGTSSDGRTVLPFRSSLFEAAFADHDPADLWIQPVSVAYTRYVDGRVLRGTMGDHYAWYGEMTLVDHVARVFGLEGASVEVTLHPPVRAIDFADRKALAKFCRNAVAAGLASSVTGRPMRTAIRHERITNSSLGIDARAA